MAKSHFFKINIIPNGQVLIEVLVALGVIVVVITTVTIATINSLSNVQFSKNNTQATHYAQQGIDVLRYLRNNQLERFKTYTGNYCFPDTTPPALSQSSACNPNILCTPTNTSNCLYKRQVNIDAADQTSCLGGAKVRVTVSWTDGKCQGGSFCHQAEAISCIATNLDPGGI